MKLHWKFILLFMSLTLNGRAQSTDVGSKEIVCFIYHRFDDARYPSTNISLKDFETHLRYLKENDFQVITFSSALDYLQSSKPSRKTVVITIDDAYKSFYEHALPLLKKYKFPATLFINTETIGSTDFMSWAQLTEARKANIEIGNHTHSHAYFLNEKETSRYLTFENELRQSQQIITKNLNFTPSVFSYPYGEYDEQMKTIVQKNGFRAAAVQKSGVWHSGLDVFEIPRFPMSEDYARLHQFKEKALMKALIIKNLDPKNTLLGKTDSRPKLTLTFDRDNLQLDRLQCFIQGGQCSVKVISTTQTTITLTLQSTHSIATRRRTLYTITIPDANGSWHWFSHLWINPGVK